MKQTVDRQRDEHLELPFKFASQTARQTEIFQNKNANEKFIRSIYLPVLYGVTQKKTKALCGAALYFYLSYLTFQAKIELSIGSVII